MVSRVPSRSFEQISFPSGNSKRYSFKNFRVCQELQDELKNLAIRRISGDLLKSLIAIKRSEFVEARNRVDVPHGLFSLRLEKFYERCAENTVYIDVLELICRETLEQAKFCIVLEDLEDYVRRLFLGYHSQNMNTILMDIQNSQRLQMISETMVAEFKNNSKNLKNIKDKLNAFNVRERNALNYMNNQVYGVQNNCVEAELVVDPIEFRYKLNYHNRTTEQREEELIELEEGLQNTIDDLAITHHRESVASDTIRLKYRMDIEMLKRKLDEMTKRYDKDYDALDSQISYKNNSIELMQLQHKDCLVKLDFFAVDKLRLIQWHTDWEAKRREEAMAILKSEKKAKKKGKKGNPKKA